MASTSLAKVIPLVSLLVSGVWAQLTDMAQCSPGFEWNHNSLGEDACTIGSKLDASCRGLVSYTYPPLNISQYYVPPRKDHAGDLDCDCNTVMYNFYMACASCQGAEIYSWQSWIVACETVYVAQLPFSIPQGTAVPHWAYSNVTSAVNQTYDGATMISIGRDPEEKPKPINTMTSGGGTISTPRGTKSSTGGLNPTGASGVSTRSGTNVGAIVGGVVGSIVPLTILAFAVFFYMRSRREKDAQHRQSQMLSPDGMDPYKQRPPSMYGPPPINTLPFAPYNPSDPSTFPPQSPPSSATYTTPINPVRGTYSGAPEV